MNVAAQRRERLVGLAADEDPALGFIGVLGLKDVARACEEYQVASARAAGWTWAQIAAAPEVSPQAVQQKHATRTDHRRVGSRTHDDATEGPQNPALPDPSRLA